MKAALERLERALPAVWAGALITIAGIATPAPFATLAPADAGRVVARILAQEAWLSLLLGVVVLLGARRRAAAAAAAGRGSVLNGDMLLVLGTIACTVVGYFGVQPLIGAARAGTGLLSFGQLHSFSVGCYLLKCALVVKLAWRAASGSN